ncbi:hypothetical protein, partial [Paenibacillus xylanexedens]|uniref:hypothetical protein n=1 Tax=Paenibacillus xylanexedens TaxID=528191 RepID=UPI001642AE72
CFWFGHLGQDKGNGDKGNWDEKRQGIEGGRRGDGRELRRKEGKWEWEGDDEEGIGGEVDVEEVIDERWREGEGELNI